MRTLKVDIINEAFSKLRISGITAAASPEDLSLALYRLESMMAEFEGRNIRAGYNFQDVPDLNDVHNVPSYLFDAVASCLASRVAPDFGKAYDSGGSLSFLHSATAQVRQSQYDPRHPIGRGNRYRRYIMRSHMPVVDQAPNSALATVDMYVDDIREFTEHFDTYLKDGEDIASFTISADTGLTITTSANATPDITYTIRADGGSGADKSVAALKVKIVVTTTDGRKETRVKNFNLIEVTTS